MANKDLNINPHIIDDNTWWYEDNGGIELHHDVHTPGGEGEDPIYSHHIGKKISWVSLRNALKRKDT